MSIFGVSTVVRSRTYLVLVTVVLFAFVGSAQLVPGRIALTTAVGLAPDVGASYAISDRLRLNFGIGFNTSSPDSGASRSTFSIETGLWVSQTPMDGVSTFYGGAIQFRSASGTRTAGDMGIIAQAGAEYAFSKRFSAGSYVGLEFRTGDTSADGKKGAMIATTRVGLFLSWWIL